MAEVTDCDRGQLLLVAGIVLAVLFVALALLVNTAIYTDNVATRDGDAGSEPLEYQGGAVSVAGGLIEAENEASNDYTAIEGNVEGGFEEAVPSLERTHLRRGAATETEANGFTEGRHIQHDDIDDWSVSGADGVRAFSMTLDTDSMDPIDIDDEDDPDPFNIDLGDGELEVYLDAEHGDELTVRVDGEVRCRVNEDDVAFNVTAEQLNGEPCPLGLSSDLDGDSVGFDNADTVGDGGYELVVATTSEPADPQVSEALYSVELDIGIYSPDLSYESTVTVAPGEFDG